MRAATLTLIDYDLVIKDSCNMLPDSFKLVVFLCSLHLYKRKENGI